MNYLKEIGFNIMRGFRKMISETRTAKNTKQPFLFPPGISREFHLSLRRSETRTRRKEGFFLLHDRGEHTKKNV
jgi:hypothetical protein